MAAAGEPQRYQWVDGADHNDLMWMAGDRYSSTLQEESPASYKDSILGDVTAMTDPLPSEDIGARSQFKRFFA